jgi:hypothetical protein
MPDLDLYLESSPREIFAAFEGAIRHMPPTGSNQTLAFGYLFLLQQLLEHLRYRTDNGFPDSAKLITDFQAEVAAQVRAGRIDGLLLSMVGAALHEARIAASPELTEVSSEQQLDSHGNHQNADLPADFQAAVSGLLEASGGDPFRLVGTLAEFGHSMPAETRGALAAAIAYGAASDGRAATVLFLLDPDPVVRHAAASTLASVAASLSPTDVRRLIAMRNWRPEKERAEIDVIVRKARAAGIQCAQWEAGGTATILSSAIDGSGAQGFLLVSAVSRKKRLSSILTKSGIADAWSGEPESARRIEATISEANTATPMHAVSRPYLDGIVAHHLALTVEKGISPSLAQLESRHVC